MKSYNLKEELTKRDLILWGISEMEEFLGLIRSFKGTDGCCYSKSYEELRDLWYGWIHLKLDEYDFVSGEPSENTWDKRPKACFWWDLYQRQPEHYRPYHHHHCSSIDRKEQMINILEDLLLELKKEN